MIKEQKIMIEEDQGLTNDHWDLIRVINRYSCTYLRECAEELGLSEYHVKQLLKDLTLSGIIERTIPHPAYPKKHFLLRVIDQSLKGQGGYENFKRKTWYKFTEKGSKISAKVAENVT